MANARPKVVVVGAGFGGLTAVRELAREPVDVLLIDRHNFHTFTPLLYQVATALLDPSEVAHPVREIVRPLRNVEARLAEVRGVDLEARRLDTDHGPVAYDYLLLAAGSETNYFGIAGLEQRSFGLKDMEGALGLRNQVLSAFEEAAWTESEESRQRLLTIAIVGGGPTGVELAGAFSELVGHVLGKDYGRALVKDARIVLLEAGPSLLAAFTPRLREHARRTLLKRGIDVRLETAVKSVEGDLLTLADGNHLHAGTIVWTAGVRGGDLGGKLAAQLGRSGRVPVNRNLQLEGHPEVFVIGDLGGFEEKGQQLPMLAPVAIQEGRRAARNIGLMARGTVPLPFRYYDPGIMATIGRNSAVAEVGPLKIGGFLGWLAWLGLHLIEIVGFRSRVVVLFNWAWNYVFLDRPIRLLLRAAPPPALDPASSPRRIQETAAGGPRRRRASDAPR